MPLIHDPSALAWRKSSHSGHQGECVEVAGLGLADVAVRDSTDPSGPVLAFSRAEWKAFFEEIKDDTAIR
ncbi:DUF397 domain-containing protein [Actinomadura sp. 9N407]|uniref:DUF397 domain-containing protein n=1 Tax=Actinomadura sp. 9N407 TaxID=3375154 RepID=UPI00379901A8